VSSQEELAGCLLQLIDALTPRLSIVRDGNKPCVVNAQERDEDGITAAIRGPARPNGTCGVCR
jgi:hypothetical protein